MGRANRRTKKGSNPPPGPVAVASTSKLPGLTSTIAIAADPTRGYKIRVLLYDFLNVTKDPNSERRINSTTDEHYVSAPYFDHDQAMVVKAAIVDADLSKHDPKISDYTDAETPGHADLTTWPPYMRHFLENAIEKAYNDFLASLPEKEKLSLFTTPCASADDIVKEIKSLDIMTRRGSSSKTCISMVQKLGDQLEPFFKIVEIFVSSKPEIAALVWGSVRFVFKLAETYTTFFDKLTQLLSSLTDAIPQYDEMLELCVKKPTQTQDEKSRGRIRLHIGRIYEDIFSVLHIATSVLTKPDGKRKRTPVVSSSLVWKPFEARFGEVMERMATNRLFVFQQLMIWNAAMSSHEITKAAEERDVSSIEREDAALERKLAEDERKIMEEERALSAEHRHDTTARLEAIYRKLQDLESKRKGNPGAGKTVLATSIVEELQRAEPQDESCSSVHYYFFDHHCPPECAPSSAYRAIAAQLLWENRTDSTLLDRLTFLMDTKKGGQLHATDAQLLDILHLCLDPNAVVILDGVDECTDSESFSQALLGLSNRLPSLRLLILSRVNVSSLKLAVPPGRRFAMQKRKTRPDIYRFFAEKLEDMAEDGLLPEASLTDEDKASLTEHLCKGADGMFLWARLMIRCLRSAHLTRQRRLRMIREVNLPEGLEKMYERIVAVIHAPGSHAASLASKILTWLAFSIVPVTSRQLRAAIAAQEGEMLSADDDEDEVTEFQECAVMACAGLVEPSRVGPNSECPKGEKGLRFIHLSLQELIEAKKNIEGAQFSLMAKPPGVALGHDIFRAGPQAITELQHFDDPQKSRMEASAREVRNWIKAIDKGYMNDQKPTPALLSNVRVSVESLILEVQKVEETWHTQLEKTPGIVWDEMTFFAKSRMFVSLNSMDMTVQEPEAPDYPGISDIPVAKMSKTSLDGSIKGILCIWAPRFIHDRNTFSNYRLASRNRRKDIRWLCEGWVATYQVWQMDHLERPTGKIQLALCPEDIIQPIRQYLDHPMARGLDLPLEIGADAASFCILRTVYFVKTAQSPSDSKIFSQTLGTLTPNIEPDFTWAASNSITPQHSSFFYNLYFSLNGSFLALHESEEDVSHLLAFECQRDVEHDLLVKLVNKLEIHNSKVEKLCFHHTQPLLAFSVVFNRDRYTKHRVLLIWNFSHDKSQTLTTTRGQSRELSKALASTMMTQVDTSGAGTEVSLTRYEGEAIRKSKVVTLPRSAHFEGAVHKVLPHLSQQDMFRVSVDMDRRRHYSLDAPSGGPNASVIEKHAAFVGVSSSPSPSTRTHEHGLGRLAVDGVEWRQCKCDVLWIGGYMAIHSRGASALGSPDAVNLMKPAEIPAAHGSFSSQGCSRMKQLARRTVTSSRRGAEKLSVKPMLASDASAESGRVGELLPIWKLPDGTKSAYKDGVVFTRWGRSGVAVGDALTFSARKKAASAAHT
ncbi:hypothetical protein ACO1O0_003597 [Amphichorda felina]